MKTLSLVSAAVFAVGCASVPAGGDDGFNTKVLAAVRSMPRGGGYDGSDAAKNRMPEACSWNGGALTVDAGAASPGFCSGATYLVLLDALGSGPREMMPVTDQIDGHGIFGRWNANGPGCAKLVADLGAGVNFTSWDEARPGDFLKIWWTDEIGGRERGHHVVYLGRTGDIVRYWSSNQPGGYGVKTARIDECRRVLFTRITRPDRFAAAGRLPERDAWLEAMLRKDFTWSDVVARCMVRP
ncbi:MAG: hypothetical protein H7A50_10810 [Akkermansiaceae bacterium]|nr:hypothetical protein [Akkermansiaceae bacterium]